METKDEHVNPALDMANALLKGEDGAPKKLPRTSPGYPDLSKVFANDMMGVVVARKPISSSPQFDVVHVKVSSTETGHNLQGYLLLIRDAATNNVIVEVVGKGEHPAEFRVNDFPRSIEQITLEFRDPK